LNKKATEPITLSLTSRTAAGLTNADPQLGFPPLFDQCALMSWANDLNDEFKK
jgi:hypothetical protein